MSSRKPNRKAKKPAKGAPKKPALKTTPVKRPKRPATKPKPKPKPALSKVTVKPDKSALKSTSAKATAATATARAKLVAPAAQPKLAKPGKPAKGTKSSNGTELTNAVKPANAANTMRTANPANAAAKASAERVAPIKFDIKPLVIPRTVSADEEADFDSPPASLLAGPRNVKPYIPRRGEQYMNKEQMEHFAHILHSWKQDLMVEVDRTVLHMKDEAANFPDPNDRATQEEEFSLELRTRDRERKLIRKIDEALKRIEDGTYGYCMETGEEIGIKRLEARPVATLSVEAQERRERREKQYGDRDDRYR